MEATAAPDATATPSTTSFDAAMRGRLPSSHLPSRRTDPLLFPGRRPSPSSSSSSARTVARSDDARGRDNFPTGCAFSPDGTCILTATASDGAFRLYDTPFRHLHGDGGGEGDDSENDDGAASTLLPQHEACEDSAAPAAGAATTATTNRTNTTTYSHNQNYHPPSTHSDTHQQRAQNKLHPWKASLTSHLGGPPPSSSSAAYAWYPLMTSSSPLTSLFATCRGHSMPIHLIDAYTSKLRASYRPYNGVDEMEGPTVVEFSPDGRKIYGTGFKTDRTIAVFDASVPGREGMVARLGKTRRSKDGQKGVPSALAFPRGAGGGGAGGGPSNVFAVGTYSPASIYIYDDRMSAHFNPAGTIVLHGGAAVVGHGRAFSRKKRRFGQIDDDPDGRDEETEEEDLFSSARVGWFQSRARGGVTQLTWAPPGASNPHVLYSASRRSDAVLSWDVRALSCRDSSGGGGGSRGKRGPVCGLRSYGRDGDTNQRLEFDLDANGERLFAGSGEGAVRIYDARSGTHEGTLDVVGEGSDGAGCAANGVSYFPHGDASGAGRRRGLLAVAVGSRMFDDVKLDDGGGDGAAGRVEPSPGFLQLHELKG